MSRIIDDLNYYADSRVRAKQRGRWYHTILDRDHVEMEKWTDEGDQVDVKVRVIREVCPTCEGVGSHTNPSIEYLAEEFYDDPGFLEEYRRGSYTEPCYECHGEKVVLRPDPDTEKEIIEYLAEEAQIEYDSFMEQQAERRMGC